MRLALMTSLAVLIAASPVLAGDPPVSQPAREKPVRERDASAKDVATTPITDLNLRKDEIPTVLTNATQQAYGLSGISTCSQIAAAVEELDAALGPDIDLPQNSSNRIRGGRVAQSVVGSFIPFRGVIREVSGANNRDRELNSAIMAGVARRAFLKGTGQARNCRYPARSAALEVRR
jgi:hypothetical protein